MFKNSIDKIPLDTRGAHKTNSPSGLTTQQLWSFMPLATTPSEGRPTVLCLALILAPLSMYWTIILSIMVLPGSMSSNRTHLKSHP